VNILPLKNVSVLDLNYGTYIGCGLIDERHQHVVRARQETLFRWFEEGELHATTSHRFHQSNYAARWASC
jgi:hypothetical protein